MNGSANIAFLAACLLAAAPANAQTSRQSSLTLTRMVRFCKARGTVDHPPTAGFGSPDDGGVPPELAAMSADRWRCLNGQVLVCADSADGDQCGRKDASRHPPTLIEECRGAPDDRQISFAAGHFSRFDWTCRGGAPVIARAHRLDQRGFFQKAWARLVIRRGRVVSPAAAPDLIR
jgi:hypothetical protein